MRITIPNLLSILRIILVPFFIMTFLSGMPYSYNLAIGIFALAGITDIVDGRLARKLGQVTMLGRALDPLADKLMIFSALLCMTIRGIVPLWMTVVFLAKETLQGIGGLIAFKLIHDVPASNLVGKAATIFFYVAIGVNVLFPGWEHKIRMAFLLFAFTLMFAAMIIYLIGTIKKASKKLAYKGDRT